MKTISKIILLAVITVMCLMCAPVQVLAASDGTNGDEFQLMEAEKLEIQLGEEWAGVEFQLKTDAGLYPRNIAVGGDGVLRLEIGGSKTYILSCLSSAVKTPEPSSNSDATESESNKEVPSETAESSANAGFKIPVLHIVLFVGGLAVAIGVLIIMSIVKRRRDFESEYDEDE